MKTLTRLQILEKQNKDLRARLENRQGKSELALCAFEDGMKALKSQHTADKNTIVMLQSEIKALTAENFGLREDKQALYALIDNLRSALDKAEDRAARLEAMLKKDSSTSDRPPSNDFARAKAESTKEKSGKKAGGQPGHLGRRLMPSAEPDEVVNKMPPPVCPGCGGEVRHSGHYESRQVIDVEFQIKVTEERAHDGCCADCGKVSKGEFSDVFNSYVSYGPIVKAIAAILNTDANVPINKTAQVISSLTGARINMSDGTVVNIVNDLAARLNETVQDIIISLASCGVLNVDETGVRINGNLNWIQIITNESFSLYGRNLKRGTPNTEMNDLILLFTGMLVHDHLLSYYGYKHISHAECNVHILRYLKAVVEIMHHAWAKEMADLLKEANDRKKKLLADNIKELYAGELEAFREKYNGILARGQAEYEAAIEGKENITYYDEERRLLKRLNEYMEEHLRFFADFTVPFSNNRAEHGARHIKGKKKTSGGFRSDGGVDSYAVVASVIASLRKQSMNVFSAFSNTFSGYPPRFVGTIRPDTG